MYLNESTPQEASLIIKSLKDSQAQDINGITTYYVKSASRSIAYNLSILFNQTIKEGMFPDMFKLAKIIPVFKNDSPLTPSNYRPISILPILSKIFERLMYNRLLSFVSTYKLLVPHQYGFQTGKSTELALNEICSNIKNTFERKETAFCIFLDFAKAFDTVNHEIFLKKLEFYGIRGTPLLWFKTYLEKRQQCTEIGNSLSDMDDITCGVPQGSILGPLLFLLYINDIVLSSNILKFYLFADDTTIFYSTKVNAETEQILNNELNKVHNWLNCNKLSLNISKSCFLKFSQVKEKFKVKPKMAKKPIEQKKVAKYLGILVDENLNWKAHIDSINIKMRKGLGMINKVKDLVTTATLKTLYYSFIYPYLDNNLINWSSAPISYLKCLTNTNKKAIKTIHRNHLNQGTSPYKQLEILPLDSLIKFRRGQFMWKVENNILPKTTCSWFQQNKADIYMRMNLSKYLLPNPRTELAKRHNSFSAVKLWNNDIPEHIKSAFSFSVFRSKYKTKLLSSL